MSIPLNNLIRETIANHPHYNHQKIAHTVANLTPPDDLETFYIAALEPLVADIQRLSRNATLNNKQGKSPKVEQRRTWWNRVLKERVHIGESQYKTIAACTADDLKFCIAERQNQIGQLRGQIEKYERIHAAILEHGVETVGELPDTAVDFT